MSSPAVRGDINSELPGRSLETRNALAALPRLVGLWPDETVDLADPVFATLLARLRRALRAERQRGIAGHWSYDLARHSELLAVYRILADAHLQSAQPVPPVLRETKNRPRTLRCEAD
jgi:hypothetical protein